MNEFESLVILAVMFAILGMGIDGGISLLERKIRTGKLIVIDNSSYRCKIVNTLKEE